MTLPVLDGLRQIADDYDGFIVDLWGVIHDGSTAYPGAVETLAYLKEHGKAVILLSNAPRRPQPLADSMAEMGIPPHLYTAVVSSGEAVRLELQRRTDPWFARLGTRCLHMGTDDDTSIYEDTGLQVVGRIEQADFLMNTGTDRMEATVEDYLPLLREARKRGLPMVCANPDLVVVREGQKVICAGSLAKAYGEMGGDVAYRGKPDPAIYAVCFERMGIHDPRRVLAVGDGLPTDIAGAHRAGIDSLLITGGIHADQIGTRYGDYPNVAAVERVIAANGNLRPTAAAGGFIW
jgi:HAD superfamily hydrolase (TIGR01459 family)